MDRGKFFSQKNQIGVTGVDWAGARLALKVRVGEDFRMDAEKRQERGLWGEQVAERYLRKEKGMRVMDRRWRHGHGELDLILRWKGVLVIAEVRVRSMESDRMATYHSIGRKKWRVLRKTAQAYCRQCMWEPVAIRFDVVGIRVGAGGKVADITHWENVGVFGKNYRF